MKKSLAELRAVAWAACGALTLMSASASAQTPPESDTMAAPPAAQEPESSAAPVAVEDKKIEQFADAYIAVQEIQAKASEQLSATTDVAKADNP